MVAEVVALTPCVLVSLGILVVPVRKRCVPVDLRGMVRPDLTLLVGRQCTAGVEFAVE